MHPIIYAGSEEIAGGVNTQLCVGNNAAKMHDRIDGIGFRRQAIPGGPVTDFRPKAEGRFNAFL